MIQKSLFPDIMEDQESSHLASPVSRIQSQDSKTQTTSVSSGLSFPKLLHKSDPTTLFLRMFQALFPSHLTIYPMTLSLKVSPRQRCYFQLVRVSEAPTKEKESSSSEKIWPTPTTQEIEHPNMVLTKTGRRMTKDGKSSHSLNLADKVKMWPTPRVSDTEGGIVKNVELHNGSFSRKNAKGERWGVKLKDAVNHVEKMWPTPTANQAGEGKFLDKLTTKDGEPPKQGERAYNPETGQHVQVTLNRAVKMWPTPMSRDWKGGRKPETLEKAGRRPSNSLPDAITHQMFPTPTANEDAAGRPGTKMQKMLGNHPDVRGQGEGTLNYEWVSVHLMGFPRNWLEV